MSLAKVPLKLDFDWSCCGWCFSGCFMFTFCTAWGWLRQTDKCFNSLYVTVWIYSSAGIRIQTFLFLWACVTFPWGFTASFQGYWSISWYRAGVCVSGMPNNEMLKIQWIWLKLNNNSYKNDWKGPLPYGLYRLMRDDELTDQWLNAKEM